MINLKKFILLIILLFFSGCQVKYKLEFIDNELIENINIEIEDNNSKQINDLKLYEAYAIFDTSYQKLYDVNFNQNDTFSANYKYNYSLNEFNHAMYINTCFDGFSFISSNDNYVLSTSKGFKCMVLDYNRIDKIEIKVSTNHEIIESNADEIKNNELIWNINENNAKEKSIYIRFGQIKELNFFEKNWLGISILGGLVIIVLAVVIFIIIIGKKNNEID